jgi:hypothetical protein
MSSTERNFKNHTTSDGRSDAKPAVIHLVNGESIDAPDHDTRNGWVIVYYSSTTGIDKKVLRESVLYIVRVETVNADSQSNNDRDDGELVTDGGWTELLEAPKCNRCGGKREDLNASICHSCAHEDSKEVRENADVEPGDCVVYTGSIEELQDTIWVFDYYACWHTATLIDGEGNLVKRVDVRTLAPVPDDRADEKPEPPYTSYDVENHHRNDDGELGTDGGSV